MIKMTLYTLCLFALGVAPIAVMSPNTAEANMADSCIEQSNALLAEITNGDKAVIDDEGKVVVEMDDGQAKDLTGSTEAAKPRENWHGNPPANKAAVSTLEAAIELAENGKHDACAQMLADARHMLTVDDDPAGADTAGKTKAN